MEELVRTPHQAAVVNAAQEAFSKVICDASQRLLLVGVCLQCTSKQQLLLELAAEIDAAASGGEQALAVQFDQDEGWQKNATEQLISHIVEKALRQEVRTSPAFWALAADYITTQMEACQRTTAGEDGKDCTTA